MKFQLHVPKVRGYETPVGFHIPGTSGVNYPSKLWREFPRIRNVKNNLFICMDIAKFVREVVPKHPNVSYQDLDCYLSTRPMYQPRRVKQYKRLGL